MRRPMERELRDLGNTLKLLYQVDRSAFVVGTATSVLASVVYPFMLLVVWQGLGLVLAGPPTAATWKIRICLSEQQCRDVLLAGRLVGLVLLGLLFGLLALETVLRIISETATNVLQAESAQQINARIMGKMAEVPYHLFEDNDFQARYGLLISQASHQPGQLVLAFIGSVSALVASLAVAATLFAFAPILVVFLLMLFPLAAAEARYHWQIVQLQT